MMIKRRSFVIGASTIGAVVAAASTPALVSPSTLAEQIISPNSGKIEPISVVLNTVGEGAQDLVASYLEAGCQTASLISWSTTDPASWAANKIQMHTRYLPFADGAGLSRALVDEARAGSNESYWSGRQNAIAVDVHGFAVLVDVSKAKRRQIGTITLAGFAEQSVRPYFYFERAGSAPENSWVLPVIAEHIDFDQADASSPAFSNALRRGVDALIELCESRLDLQMGYGSLADIEYDRLIDPRSDRVAMYGNPATLSKRLTRGGNDRDVTDFQVVSLQDFTGITAPSIFASTYLQVGRLVDHPSALQLMRALAMPQIQDALSSTGPFAMTPDERLDACTDALCQAGRTVSNRSSPLLPALLDGGGLVSLLTTIEGVKEFNKAYPRNKIDVSAHAAACMQERLQRVAACGSMQAMAAAAATAPELYSA